MGKTQITKRGDRMPGPFTVVTFRDADGDEFPITLIGRRATMEEAITEANGILTQAIWEGKLRPTQPIRVDLDRDPYEWGGGA
jgi:hypothetical protein